MPGLLFGMIINLTILDKVWHELIFGVVGVVYLLLF